MLMRHRRLLVRAPRQFGGKTELGVRLLWDVCRHPVTRSSMFIAKDEPSRKKMAREKFMRIFDPRLFEVNTELVYNKKHKTNAIFMGNSDKEPDRQRGGTMRLIVGAEVAFWKPPTGQTIQDVWEKILAPTISNPMEETSGYAYLESTTNGKNGFHELWHNAKDLGFKTLTVSLSRMLELGLLTQERYDEVKNTTHPDIFRQEYEVEWVTFQGRAYWEFTDEQVDPEMEGPESWQTVVAAIDWGWSPSATCVLFGYVKDGIIHVFDEHYAKEELVEHTAEAINEKRDRWQMGRLATVGDHEPDRNAELTLRRIEVAPANKADVTGVRMQIKDKMWRRKIVVHPRCVNLRRDLEAATWDLKKEGELDYSQCTWGHYDAEAALRYLVRELSPVEAEQPEENPHPTHDAQQHRAWEMNQRRPGDDNAWGNRW